MLTDPKRRATKPRDTAYKLGDSGQLFLHVELAGGKHWRVNYAYGRNAKGQPAQKTLTLGPYPALSLLDARKKRGGCCQTNVAVADRLVAAANAAQIESQAPFLVPPLQLGA